MYDLKGHPRSYKTTFISLIKYFISTKSDDYLYPYIKNSIKTAFFGIQ